MEKTITEINNKTLKQALTVDDMGHITRAGQPVKTFEQSGHLATYLKFTDGTSRNIYVHQLVILAFKGVLTSRKNGLAVHHINTNKFDNRLENLEVTTKGMNIKTYVRQETMDLQDTIYNEERIADGIVTLKHKGILYPKQAISITGDVYQWNKKVEKWQKQSRYVGNKKYPSNVSVNVNGHGTSLGQLMAENFMITPKDKKFKIYQKDTGINDEFANDFSIRNLALVVKGKSVTKNKTVA